MSAADGGRAFVDTNVLVYAFGSTDDPRQRIANDLIETLWVEETGCLSVQVLQELAVTLTARVPRPIPAAEAAAIVADLAAWTVHRPVARDVVAALDLNERYPLSFWDAMIVRSAAALGCRALYSEDMQDGRAYEGVRVTNPFAELR
jgi:predicted nucleic acid-binding protein